MRYPARALQAMLVAALLGVAAAPVARADLPPDMARILQARQIGEERLDTCYKRTI